MSPQRTSPPMKNCLRRLSTLRVRHMPFRISLRSGFVSDASMAARRKKPSQASTTSARACSRRLMADVPGVVSAIPSGAATWSYSDLASARRNGTRAASSFTASRLLMAPQPAASNASSANLRAKGWRSATNAAKRLASPVSLVASVVRDMQTTIVLNARTSSLALACACVALSCSRHGGCQFWERQCSLSGQAVEPRRPGGRVAPGQPERCRANWNGGAVRSDRRFCGSARRVTALTAAGHRGTRRRHLERAPRRGPAARPGQGAALGRS